MLIHLDSVASVVDDQTLITYPTYESGDIDMDSPIHISQCSNEWKNSLSKEDKEMVKHLLDVKNYRR